MASKKTHPVRQILENIVHILLERNDGGSLAGWIAIELLDTADFGGNAVAEAALETRSDRRFQVRAIGLQPGDERNNKAAGGHLPDLILENLGILQADLT